MPCRGAGRERPRGRTSLSKYDLVIIGSGPGGYVAAIRGAQLGLKTAVVEKDGFLGGTCLHVGCIPTKVLLHHAEIYHHFKNAAEFGFEVKDVKVDWSAVLARKDKIVKKHSKGIEFLFRKHKIESIQGWGRVAGPGKVSIEKDGKTAEIEATNILLATGSEARSLPGVEIDGKAVLSNREILSLPELPKSLIVVGAGAVGVEFASIYKEFGCDVTILEMLPRVVPLEDEDISAELDKAFRKKGIKIHTGAMVESVKKDAKGASVTFKDKDGKSQALSAEKILIAVGRRPMTEKLGLEKTKAKVERGFVHAGPYMETAEPKLYAIGDIVAGMPQLAHAASMEGIVAVTKMAGKDAPALDRFRIPNATYCEPQIGSIGMSEKQAREAGHKVMVGKFPFAGNSKATILGAHEGFIKIVADEKYSEVLGVHIIGPMATEVLAEAATALQLEATVDDMMFMSHAHPTVWEALGDAFASVRGMSINA
ncbi:MAG: dihydrolipoyl dehydrogenase [Acidobacteria bacterium]|nr:dihydrolipoyl dehydrogenase [Acidobacteriota bacterium]MBI3662124.1 dihydrolipoyl dehydrogenase [Acidobacteriota bacterium]